MSRPCQLGSLSLLSFGWLSPVARCAATALLAPLLCSPGRAQTQAQAQAQTQTPHHPRAVAPVKRSAVRVAQAAPLSPAEQAEQIVNRFTFGATPGLVQAVAAQGWQPWFAEQLEPETLPDPVVQKRLQAYPTLTLPPPALAVRFPDGQVIRRIAEGKLAMPDDPRLAAVYQVLLARYQEKQEKDRAQASIAASAAASAPNPTNPQAEQKAEAGGKAAAAARAAVLAGPVLALAPAARLDAILALPIPDRTALTRGLAEPLKTELLQGIAPEDREMYGIMAGGYGGNGVVAGELEQAKLVRAVLSSRQLQEVLTDFWVNHFNIDLNKSGDEVAYAGQFEAAAIRPHALGKFRDLLLATAQSPAMMIYLDNLTSIGPDSPAASRGAKKGQRGGLNENYGREVMELHTLGVDGGYTQADVTALADILTGWGVDRPQQGGPFLFQPQKHEPGSKLWLGHTVRDNGEQEGIDALTYLAAQPATARHISFELAQRFVNDTPPPALVDRMTATWLASDGDIREVLRAMVQSPEFFDRANFGNKVKTPLEFVASTLRATGTDPSNPGALAAQLRAMGEPLYRCQPPNGYAITGDHWMNSAALIDRLNFSIALASGKLGGMHLDAPMLVATGLMDEPTPSGPPARSKTVALAAVIAETGSDRALHAMEQALLAGPISARTDAVIRAQLAQQKDNSEVAQGTAAATPSEALNAMAAMLLGSPEFQLH